VILRNVEIGDADAITRLSEQLGYPMSVAETAQRLQLIIGFKEHGAFVAEWDGQVVGWIHVYAAHLLESPASYVEIGGLVVDEACRGKGVGRALVQKAEEWTTENGFDDIRVRSASRRAEAHAFYQRLGFDLVKTQMRFRKDLKNSK
jgi:GNAT superfamily N-acetyltransferase